MSVDATPSQCCGLCQGHMAQSYFVEAGSCHPNFLKTKASWSCLSNGDRLSVCEACYKEARSPWPMPSDDTNPHSTPGLACSTNTLHVLSSSASSNCDSCGTQLAASSHNTSLPVTSPLSSTPVCSTCAVSTSCPTEVQESSYHRQPVAYQSHGQKLHVSLVSVPLPPSPCLRPCKSCFEPKFSSIALQRIF